jgi:hypothetical protein
LVIDKSKKRNWNEFDVFFLIEKQKLEKKEKTDFFQRFAKRQVFHLVAILLPVIRDRVYVQKN